MAENLVDVVAAAAEVERGSKVSAGDDLAPQPPRRAAEAASSLCPLGHPSAPGTRFCGECGLPVGELSLGPRVDLEAIREAVKPAAALDAEERARRDREHAEAVAANLRAEQEVVDLARQADPSERKVVIHFVTDGFTWAGKVFYAGEELAIGPDHPRWQSAVSWIRLTKAEQFQRYGRVFFDFGPYPGRSLPQGTEYMLPTAGVSQWAVMRGGMPARPGPDGDGALIPR
jgi:hypothetical protein